ncbi:MAG: hypothetical protein IBX63_10760 [Coriobacteriia bacterium]|nr:hypothetical protein [Coriobacteriia bacterium]
MTWGVSGAGKMRHSTDGGSTWSAWEPYAATKNLTLPAPDGPKTVRAQFEDAAGNVSVTVIEGSIELQTTVPSGTIEINAGASYTNSTGVTVLSTVNWSAGDPGQMRFSTDGGSTWSAWELYAATKNLTLPTGDGTKTVRAEFRDTAEVTSTDVIEDSIILDTTAPTGSIAVNGGAVTTSSTSVTVNNAVDFAVSGVHATEAMRFTVNGGTTWSTWEPYAASKALTLPAGDGTKTVTGEFKDAAGNVASLSDTITLDTSTPTFTIHHHSAGVTFDRWVSGYSTAYSGGGYVYGRWTGTKLSVRFTGTTIRWYGPKQPFYGMADVYLDGGKVATVDCYASAEEATLSEVIWESGTLSDAPHTLEIRLTGAKNPASTSNIVVIDYFEVEGAAPAGGGQRIDETAGTLSGPWIYGTNRTYINGGYHYSKYSNATFTATFEGTKVAWIGPKTGNYGRAKVYIDGVQQGSVVSQYGTMGWRERVWESKTLTPGDHTIKIVPTGTKDAASKSTIVVIDALDVTP